MKIMMNVNDSFQVHLAMIMTTLLTCGVLWTKRLSLSMEWRHVQRQQSNFGSNRRAFSYQYTCTFAYGVTGVYSIYCSL